MTKQKRQRAARSGEADCSARCYMCKRKTDKRNEYGLCEVCAQALAPLKPNMAICLNSEAYQRGASRGNCLRKDAPHA